MGGLSVVEEVAVDKPQRHRGRSRGRRQRSGRARGRGGPPLHPYPFSRGRGTLGGRRESGVVDEEWGTGRGRQCFGEIS